MMGGNVHVETSPGHGSTFSLAVPIGNRSSSSSSSAVADDNEYDDDDEDESSSSDSLSIEGAVLGGNSLLAPHHRRMRRGRLSVSPNARGRSPSLAVPSSSSSRDASSTTPSPSRRPHRRAAVPPRVGFTVDEVLVFSASQVEATAIARLLAVDTVHARRVRVAPSAAAFRSQLNATLSVPAHVAASILVVVDVDALIVDIARSLKNRPEHIRVVGVVAALTTDAIAEQACAMAGADAVVRHPILRDRLAAAVTEAYAKKTPTIVGDVATLPDDAAKVEASSRAHNDDNDNADENARKAAASSLSSSTSSVAAAAAADRPPPRCCVLLVDDMDLMREVTKTALESLNCHVYEAANGKEAVDVVARVRASMSSSSKKAMMPIDLVLMDCEMPVMNGFDATRRIREGEQRADELAASSSSTPSTTKPLTIVAMTGNAMQGDREKCLEAGMTDFLSKPVSIAKLRALVDAAVKASGGKMAPSLRRSRRKKKTEA